MSSISTANLEHDRLRGSARSFQPMTVSTVFTVFYRCWRAPTRQKARPNGIFRLSHLPINGRKRSRNGAKTAQKRSPRSAKEASDISELLLRKPNDREFTRKRFAHLLWAMAPRSRAKNRQIFAGHCPSADR